MSDKSDIEKTKLSTSLTVTKAKAKTQIQTQIQKGEALQSSWPRDENGFEKLKAEFQAWHDFNRMLLRKLFTTDEIVTEYLAFSIKDSIRSLSFEQLIQRLHDEIKDLVAPLKSIYARLDLYEVVTTPRPVRDKKLPNLDHKKSTLAEGELKMTANVFLVHGHDDRAKETIARFLEKLNFNVVILHEQANKGRTIIEKFQDHSNVAFAVVILTGDDIGASRLTKDNLQPRARQNVILELGFFIGTLGRGKTCALVEQGVEIPSDISGVLYIPLDPAGLWRMTLVRELKAAGLDVDLNKAIT